MHKQTIGLAAGLALAAYAPAQQALSVNPIPSAVKNAGIYHVATGTWTRGNTQIAALGPDVIYANDANSGYFAPLGMPTATGDYSIIDEGRIPTPNSAIANVDRVRYTVDALEFSYCSDVVGPNVGITFNLYDSYSPCDLLSNPTDPVVLAGSLSATGLPGGGSTGAVACWALTIDISGGGEFCLEGDGGSANPGTNGNLPQDSFGIEWVFNGVFGTETGPMLAGNPNWTGNTLGSISGVGGGGTYYDPSVSACLDRTGLDTQDLFAVDGYASGAPRSTGFR